MFLDVYPLEKPGSGRVEESEFLSKQHSEMADLLTDRCHVVRIIAIKVLAILNIGEYLVKVIGII